MKSLNTTRAAARRMAIVFVCAFQLITSLSADNYYWVNGSGDWSDFAGHWAKIPNPTLPAHYHANIPTDTSDVYFGDTNGGAAYTVNVNGAFTVPKCRNMDWTASPAGAELGGTGGRLDIYGSVVLKNGMLFTYSGEVHFIAFGATSTILSDGVHFSAFVVFEGTGGGWILNDPIFVDNSLVHSGGELNTNGKTVTIGNVFQGNSPGKLKLGDSDFINNGNYSRFHYSPLDFDAGTSHIIVNNSAEVEGASAGWLSGCTFYDVTFTQNVFNGFTYGNIAGTLTFLENGSISSYGFNSAPLINRVIFHKNATILGAFNYNHLTFSAGKTYTVFGQYSSIGTDQTILLNGSLTALGAGTCAQFITIKSWQYGTAVKFINNSGADIMTGCVILEDIHAAGTHALINKDGVDLGNNTGWIFDMPNPGLDLYWVGGAGDWNDPCHWTDDPLSLVGDCGCIPNGGSNVHFTANSGFSPGDQVTVLEDAYCLNMDWTGVTGEPEFYHPIGGAVNLHIYDTLTLDAGVDFNFGGTVRFRTSDTATITSVGQDFDYKVVFEGTGVWELQDTLKVLNFDVFHKRGTFKTLGHPMLINYWWGNALEDGTALLINMGAELWLGEVGGSSSTVSLVKSTQTNNKGHFRCFYEAGKFHAVESHIIGEKGGYIDCAPHTFHDFWDVTFNPIDHAGDFLYGNILNKLTFLAFGNLAGQNSHIREVEFHKGAYLFDSHTYDIITIHGGHNFKFQPYTGEGSTVQTITAGGVFSHINTSCEYPTVMHNPTPGETTTFRKEGAGTAFDIQHTIFDRVYADQTSGAIYTATNCVAVQPDVEASWSMTNPVPRTLYWVGSAGDWHSAAHWSLASGGAGGECPPTAHDDVFFNGASGLAAGDAVTVNQKFAYCKDMDWTGVGNGAVFDNTLTFATDDPYALNNLAIFGSLTFSSGMVNNFISPVWLRAKTPATITSAGNHFKNDLRFSEPAGDWTLNDELWLDQDLVHQFGKFRTNDQLVKIGRFWGNPYAKPSAEVFLENSTVIFLGDNVYGYGFAYLYYAFTPQSNFHAGTSSLVFENTNANGLFTYGYNVGLYNVTFKSSNTQMLGGHVENKLVFENYGYIDYGIPGDNFIKEVEFHGDALLADSRSYHSMKFAPGKRYTFGGGYDPSGTKTQTLVPHAGTEGQFIAQGLPGQYIEMKSSDPSVPAIIHKDDYDGTSTCTKYLFLTGMTHTGTEDIYVPTPGGDVFNNAGWQFFPCNPCPATIPVLDVANSITTGCPPGTAKLVLAGLKPDEWANWYTDPAATTNLVYSGGTPGPAGNMFMPVITGPVTYYARVYSDGGLCESTVVLSVDITITTPPAAFNVTGGGSGCMGTYNPIGLDGSEVGVTYHLLRDGVEVGSVLANTGMAFSFGNQTVNGTYTVVASLPNASCTSLMNGSAVISLNAMMAPTVVASSNQPLCEGGGIDLMLMESGVGGTDWAWTGPGGFNSSLQNPVIPNPAPGNSGIYTVVVTAANGCTNSSFEQVSVSPQPTVDPVADITVCSGTTVSLITFTGSPGATFGWTNSNPAIGLAADGSTWILPFIAINNGSTNITATIVVQSQSIFCTGTSQTFTITVKPSPTVDITDAYQYGCGPAYWTQPITFSSNIPGTTFTWENSDTTIGLGMNGVGDIPAFWAYGFNPFGNFAQIEVTPSDFNGCPGIPSIAEIEVWPYPEMDFPANQTVCAGEMTTDVIFTSNTPGMTYSWTNNDPSIGLAASGTGDIPAFTAINTGNTPVTAWIVITPIDPNSTNCPGALAGFYITVNPKPDVDQPAAVTVCHHAYTTINLTGTVPSTQYNWSNDNPSVNIPASHTGDSWQGFLQNNTSTVQIAHISVTPVFENNGVVCTGETKVFTVTVKPRPAVAISGDHYACSNGAMVLSETGGEAVAWSWSNGSGFVTSDQTLNVPNPTNAQFGGFANVSVTGANGCTNSLTVDVIVYDAPVAVCPPDLTICTSELPLDLSTLGALQAGGTFSGPGVTGDWFDAAPGATYQVTYTVTNADNCTEYCLFDITVNASPTVTCPPNSTTCLAAGSIVLSGGAPAGGSYSGPGVNAGVFDPAAAGVGQHSIAYSYTNGQNCTDYCSFTITVVPGQLPAIVCPAPVTVLCTGNIPAPDPGLVTMSGGCGAATVAHLFTSAPYDVDCANRFSVTRYYQATDASNNTVSCSQVITVFDDTKPNFTFVPANVTVQCNSLPAVGNPTATDNCGGAVGIAYDGQTRVDGSCNDSYTLTRQWTATDGCGNTRTATQCISVIDTQKPAFVNPPANITVQCDAIPQATAPTATDNCDANVGITYVGQTRTNGACANAYTLTRRWVASDNCNNTRSISQRITVVDNGKPTLTIPPDQTIACNVTVPTVGTATATDGCGGTVNILYLGQTTANATCPGNYQLRRTWRATDACGNSTVATQTIQVADNQQPIFTSVPVSTTIQCTQAPPLLSNPVATDNCGGFVNITYLGQVRTDGNCLYNYTLTRTWRATDLCGNAATTVQVIAVQDTAPPVFSNIPASVTVACAPNCVPPPAPPTATDNCGSAALTMLETQSPGDCATGYTVTRTWTATDQCGNPGTCAQTFTVLPTPFAPLEDRTQGQLNTQHSKPKTVTLLPNPTTDRVWIDLGDFAGETVLVTIQNDLGQRIWERRVDAVSNLQLPVNLRAAGAAAGLYTVSVRSGGQVVSGRLVLVE